MSYLLLKKRVRATELISLLIVNSRLARRGGVKRISVPVYEEMRAAMKKYLEQVRRELYNQRGGGCRDADADGVQVLRDCVIYVENGVRKTVTAVDVGCLH